MEAETKDRKRWKRFAYFFLAVLALTLAVWFLLPWVFPLPPGLTGENQGSPVLIDRHGAPIRHLVSEDFTRSAPVSLSEIPKQLIDCTLAAEDKRFHSHHGIDILATARSAFDFLKNRRVVSGASTITQQLAKISSPPASRNLVSKFREAMLARRLEMSWEKDRILAAYLARLDYGNLRISPTEAARFYFQKPLADLSLGESALLAGLPQAPSRLPATVIADIPTPLRTEQGLQLPENYDRKYRGPVTIRQALACSLNVPALRELDSLGGPEKLRDLLQETGITTLTEPSGTYGLGLTLGNAPVRLLELTNSYATLARIGNFLPTRLFTDQEIPPEKPLIDPTHTWFIADILSDRNARAPSFSTGGPLDLPFRCAVKTGTSSDFRDNWCVGYTPEFTVGVWAGNFENQPMKNISGVSGAGPIFHRSLVRAHRDTKPTWFPYPTGGESVSIDTRTGQKLAPNQHPKFSLKEWIPQSTGLSSASPSDYDEKGRAKLPPIYRDWYQSPQNLRRHELALDQTATNNLPLQILRPLNNTTILLDPEIPGNNTQLHLLTNLPEKVSWSSETLKITNLTAHLTPGTHTLTATDTRDGTEHLITITVKKL